LNGLSRIVGEYGQDSGETMEAGNLLKDAIQELKDSLKASYGDKVCINLLYSFIYYPLNNLFSSLF